jgi:hypothetical protein
MGAADAPSFGGETHTLDGEERQSDFLGSDKVP